MLLHSSQSWEITYPVLILFGNSIPGERRKIIVELKERQKELKERQKERMNE